VAAVVVVGAGVDAQQCEAAGRNWYYDWFIHILANAQAMYGFLRRNHE
jgi:hypothetical protein